MCQMVEIWEKLLPSCCAHILLSYILVIGWPKEWSFCIKISFPFFHWDLWPCAKFIFLIPTRNICLTFWTFFLSLCYLHVFHAWHLKSSLWTLLFLSQPCNTQSSWRFCCRVISLFPLVLVEEQPWSRQEVAQLIVMTSINLFRIEDHYGINEIAEDQCSLFWLSLFLPRNLGDEILLRGIEL